MKGMIMKRTENGSAVRYQFNPWLNWCFMAFVALAPLCLLVLASINPPAGDPTATGALNQIRNMMGLMCFAGLVGGLVTPARAFEIDARAREIRILSLYAFGTRRRIFKSQDVAGFMAEPVRHNGPEAYWMYLGLLTGKKVKLSPMAGRPEIAQDVHALIASALSAGAHGSLVQPRKGFGRAA